MKHLSQTSKIPSQSHSFQVKVYSSVNYRWSYRANGAAALVGHGMWLPGVKQNVHTSFSHVNAYIHE